MSSTLQWLGTAAQTGWRGLSWYSVHDLAAAYTSLLSIFLASFYFLHLVDSCCCFKMQLQHHHLMKWSLVSRCNQSLPPLSVLWASCQDFIHMTGLAFVSHCTVVTCLCIYPQAWTVCFLRPLVKMTMSLYPQCLIEHQICNQSQCIFIKWIINTRQARTSCRWASKSQWLSAFTLIHILSDSLKMGVGEIVGEYLYISRSCR